MVAYSKSANEKVCQGNLNVVNALAQMTVFIRNNITWSKEVLKIFELVIQLNVIPKKCFNPCLQNSEGKAFFNKYLFDSSILHFSWCSNAFHSEIADIKQHWIISSILSILVCNTLIKKMGCHGEVRHSWWCSGLNPFCLLPVVNLPVVEHIVLTMNGEVDP